MLYAGSDDGRVHVSKNGCNHWQEITAGLPRGKWASRLAAAANRLDAVYLTQNGKRDDDFTPYAWKSDDYGKTNLGQYLFNK